MLGTIIRLIILTVAVWVAASLAPGITYERWSDLLIAALVLGILNTFVKPILMLISLPLIVFTFGVFLVLLNALLLELTAWLVPGLQITSFGWALLGSLIVSIVSLFFGYSRFQGRE